MAATNYDAFISTSSAHRELVSGLRAEIQGFRRPFFRARGARVFLDTASLTPDHELWRALQRNLDHSGLLVLLASRTSAGSPWVAREVGHWLATRDTSSIILVLADGDILDDDRPQDCAATLKDLKAQIDQYFNSVPAGKLGAYDGCWSGQFENGPWHLRICSTGGGAQTTTSWFRPAANSQKAISCEYSGSSRPRQGGSFFVGYSQGLSCTDGTRTEHIEGLCSPLAGKGTSTRCLFTAYSCGNQILALDGKKTSASGNIILNRENQTLLGAWRFKLEQLLEKYRKAGPIVAGGVALLLLLILIGLVKPAGFTSMLALSYAPDLAELDQHAPQSLRGFPGVRKGFYRNARVCLQENCRIDGRLRTAVATLLAGPASSVFVRPGNRRVYRTVDGEEWQPIETRGRKTALGEVFRVGEAGPFFRLTLQADRRSR